MTYRRARALALILAGFATGEARALVGSGAVPTPNLGAPADQVSALQLAPAGGLALAGDGLLGRYGLSAETVLAELAPHLAGVEARPARAAGSGSAVHEYYDLYFGAYRLQGATLHLHHFENRLVMVRAALPEYRLPAEPFTAADFLPLATLGLAAAPDETDHAEPVIAESAGFAAPAWEVHRSSRNGGGRARRLVIDAQTGAVLDQTDLTFDLAQVYEKGPADGHLVPVELPDLPGTGYLDGKHFLVYAPGVGDPRAQAPDNVYDFRPDDPAEALSFDQVEAYYGATRALAWFAAKFGYDPGPTPVTIRINDLVNGAAANAQYLPPPSGPEIQIGKGDDTLHWLARDTSVVSHELSHQLIYDHVKVHTGESGIYHEGTADYFAYAINESPCLGPSIVVSGGCLRTAALDPALKFDAAGKDKGPHYLGQFWSAVLWDLRAQLGPEGGDRLVFDSMAYLGPTSGMRDGFLGLLNADRDLNPLPAGSAGAGVYGKNKCAILNAGVGRGFAAYLGEFDGASCGLNLVQLAQESRDVASGKGPPAKGQDMRFTLFGRTCAVAPGGNAPLALWWVLLVPVLIAGRPRRRGNHGP